MKSIPVNETLSISLAFHINIKDYIDIRDQTTSCLFTFLQILVIVTDEDQKVPGKEVTSTSCVEIC